MRGLGLLAALLLFASPLSARAAPEHTEHGELYDAEARVDFTAAYDRVRPEDPYGPPVFQSALAPAITGTYYLSPLVDEEMGALALLNFYQHPGELHATLGDVTRFDRVSGEWRTDQRELDLAAGGEVYPWHESGILAEMATTYSGVSADSHSALGLTYSAGLVHYFRPNLRAEVSYVGSVSQTTRVINNHAQPAIQDLDGATNAGQLAGQTVLLQDRLGVRAQLLIGQFSEDRTNTQVGGQGLPGDYTSGLLFDARGTVTGYFGREFSAALTGGVRGQTGDTRPDANSVGPSTRTVLTPFIAPEATYFFLDALYLNARYEIDFVDVSASGTPSSSAVAQQLTLSLAYRF
ncbi:MAG: hypothetical protein JST54_30810 [Deltaproteobacteria bacterium]|nr:hypothetical protein [Deltaproteobacteria bacterium]